jgi:hypothetical protein
MQLSANVVWPVIRYLHVEPYSNYLQCITRIECEPRKKRAGTVNDRILAVSQPVDSKNKSFGLIWTSDICLAEIIPTP